jgi:hypothetical protein
MMREHVDPVAGDLTPCTVLMNFVDWKALRAADWGGLAGRLARRARWLYAVLSAFSLVLLVQIVFSVAGFISHGSVLSLVAAALTAVLLLTFVTGERRLYHRQCEVVERLRALASGAQPRQAP